MTEIALVAMVLFTAQAIYAGSGVWSRLLNAMVLVFFGILRYCVGRNWKHIEHWFLGAFLMAFALFDDGFQGVDNTWVLHIPFALAIRMLISSRKMQAVWYCLELIVLVLVNNTDLTPHLDRQSVTAAFPWHYQVNLLTGILASLFMLGYYQKANARALAQALADRKAAEAAARSRGEFLSHMSHELRTPLNAMQGFAELALQDSRLPEELRENMSAIRLSADHLTHLVNDILDLAKLESGSLSLQREGFNPLACLEEVHALLLPQATAKGLRLVLDAPSFPRILGDRTRCKQILINLVSNAIKYTDTGVVDIQAAWSKSENNVDLTVSVRDTGPGISQQEQTMVFERFHRSSPNHGSSGTGLGLTISRQLARAMGGNLTLESKPGEGSTFTLRLSSLLAGPDSGDQTRVMKTSALSLAGLRILLAEDNRTNIRLASQVLQKLDATFDVAIDGGQALDLLGRFRYDLVLLDIHMPVMDGFEVARAIRNPNSAVIRHDTPILALTADAFEETRRKTMDSGMDDILTKPFRISELSDRILRLVGRMAGTPLAP
ncbi:MAG: response regulator [Fibrobacterota bacterium]|nr:MAG: response regulator [Fibrobacterota bacterium]